jgi:hypothetical protein
MDGGTYSEMSVNFFQTTRRHIPKDSTALRTSKPVTPTLLSLRAPFCFAPRFYMRAPSYSDKASKPLLVWQNMPYCTFLCYGIVCTHSFLLTFRRNIHHSAGRFTYTVNGSNYIAYEWWMVKDVERSARGLFRDPIMALAWGAWENHEKPQSGPCSGEFRTGHHLI